MSLIQGFKIHWGIPTRAFVLGLLLLSVTLVLACSDEEDTPTPDTPQTTQDSSSSTSGEPSTPTEPSIHVVGTTNFVADWARVVGGDNVEVFGLLPAGGDPHTFIPGTQDIARVADADVVFSVGLGLEGDWIGDLLRNASADESKIVELGDSVNPIESAMGMHDDHDDDHDDEHDDHADEMGHEELTGRLIIADGEAPALSVVDLITDQLDERSLQVAAPGARLYASPSGRFAFALARGPGDDAAQDDRVHIIDGGIYLEEHGDHFDLVTDPVRLLTLGTSDNRPVHFNTHAGWTAIYHDGSGRIALFEEHDLAEELNDYQPTWLDAGLQHGAAIVLEDGNVLVTTNNPDYPSVAGASSLPLGAEVWTMGGEVVYDEASNACPALHGEASNSHGIVFGCTGGVLFMHAHFGEYEHSFISNPSDMNPSARIGTLWGHHDSDYFFGSASYRDAGGTRVNGGLWSIDAEGDEMSLVLPATAEKRVRSAAFDAHGEHLLVLTYDGVMNIIHVETGEVEVTYELVEPFDGDTSPSFIVVGEHFYLSDRVGNQIVEFSIWEGEAERTWPISGQPGSLAFVGLGVDDHEDEHGHEDDHDDDHEDEDDHDDEDDHHDHDHGPLDPHFWFDPPRVKVAVAEIAARFAAIDPENAETYFQNAADYTEQLDELHAWTLEQVSQVAPERRLLVTSHDSLSYFAELYGFEIVGLVIPSLATHVEPSAEHIASVVDVVREHNVPAVFGETTVSERLAQAVALETGAELVQIYSGSLGPEGSGADTYIGMVRSNVERIVEALK